MPTLDPAILRADIESNLSFISQIVERVVAANFSKHVEAEHLLPSPQSAYRAHYIRPTLQSQQLTMSSCATSVNTRSSYRPTARSHDLSAAFDTVDHKTCWKFLVGVSVSRESCWTGLIVTLQNGQSFQQGEQRSEPYRVHCSVPRGSVLGPEEFIAYILKT